MSSIEPALSDSGPLRARLIRNVVIFGVVVALTIGAWRALDRRLSGSTFSSGWSLLVMMFFLAAYGAKKKLPFLPLGRTSSWLQLHLYGGLLTVVLLMLHVGLRIPDGVTELTLYLLYAGVALSGLVGIVLDRTLPKRLRASGEAILFDRIPGMRRNVHERAEALVLGAVGSTGSSTLAEIYVSRLRPFFTRPRNEIAHLLGARHLLREVLDEVDDAYRYADAAEKKVLDELKELAREKNLLDANHAFQWALRAWLMVHVPLTGALLIVACVHAVLVYVFRGAA